MNLQERMERLEACKSADEVADVLRAADCKGHKNGRFNCPVANYLSRADDCDRANVAGRATFYSTPEDEMFDGREWRHTMNVRHFINTFDDGTEYDDLAKTWTGEEWT